MGSREQMGSDLNFQQFFIFPIFLFQNSVRLPSKDYDRVNYAPAFLLKVEI